MLRTGDIAHGFTLPSDTGGSIDLFKKLSANPNHPLMVVFYKFNCPTCQYTFQHLPRIANEVGKEHFLAVAQDTPQEAQDFRKKYKFDFETAYDLRPYPVSVQYGLEFVPTFFIIEPDKKVSLIAEGFDKKLIEDFAQRIAVASGIADYKAFSPSIQVPLLKPG